MTSHFRLTSSVDYYSLLSSDATQPAATHSPTADPVRASLCEPEGDVLGRCPQGCRPSQGIGQDRPAPGPPPIQQAPPQPGHPSPSARPAEPPRQHDLRANPGLPPPGL